ncbi:MAG: hypothetical protein COV74_00285 [Candidatus Omnitrophica bacterium CG11_big_fil_rev_8_21_14_0_20_45_26]|uniref:Response regulatory domain-containing protein n=1 Tax=Candidatus Abzuiibacterium crystallinum TaxID=1974748 RepID=A0A2H0LV28_9BACT|nr:MAG: hypothetical protein COV74_00285 [Candidatus Omnitrophica bacterium CG11_big_fil_rev_8_21_14_0_20_45_26]PIW64624.1 MAG: hypothetical protein COW12_05495 [Candidatus Omnitrophica bacterium CG12_big_fil_rev_8_21_14_0_65_45_16]
MRDSRFCVLIVDDDEEMIAVLKDQFKQRHIEVVATTDPTTVVNKLRNFSVKLMLLDLKMRKLSGFEVLEKIKESGLSMPPTIILTGYLPKYADKLKAHNIKLDDVVTKPFDFEVLENRISAKIGSEISPPDDGPDEDLYEKNHCRVAFVEDEPDLMEDLAAFFREKNYDVRCFGDGLEALEGLRKEAVDILFVDIKLPRMSGDELITELVKLPNPPYMIPLSADPIPDETRKKLEELNCSVCVQKPYSIDRLLDLVKNIAVSKGLLG